MFIILPMLFKRISWGMEIELEETELLNHDLAQNFVLKIREFTQGGEKIESWKWKFIFKNSKSVNHQ